MNKKIVVALGRSAFGETFPEQKANVKLAAKTVADLAEDGFQIVVTHSNGQQPGMVHNHDGVCAPGSALYRRSDVPLFRHEPRLCRLRSAERHPHRAA